ncbi:hypothetical protein [Bacillus spongiae]|uniref:hypothetical protein n=1 Tax=Bacillus spongiae TaxID=2683610 RepID=UPI003AF725E3
MSGDRHQILLIASFENLAQGIVFSSNRYNVIENKICNNLSNGIEVDISVDSIIDSNIVRNNGTDMINAGI